MLDILDKSLLGVRAVSSTLCEYINENLVKEYLDVFNGKYDSTNEMSIKEENDFIASKLKKIWKECTNVQKEEINRRI